jgi:hypothetical protein
MPFQLTTEQILALAPDASAAKAGKDLANGRKWQNLGVSEVGVWGECQGSDEEPFRTAAAQTQPGGFWDGPAARLVDAQAPGLARRVRALAGIPHSGGDWPGRLLGELGLLHLAVAGYGRLETLPPEVQADVRAVVGWTQGQDEVLTGEPLRDEWLVLGQRVGEDDKLRVQRTWLWGRTSGRAALVLHFAAAKQPLDTSLVVGTRLDADLTFFPSAYPLRALVKARHAPAVPLDDLPGYPSIAAGLAAYSAGLAAYPWLDLFPLPLAAVVPIRAGEGWAVRDAAGQVLPLSPRFARGWPLLALCGGHPLGLFGEWDGAVLRPLGAWVGGRYYLLMRSE